MVERLKVRSSIGRAAVSKTAGWGFDSLLACQPFDGAHFGKRRTRMNEQAHDQNASGSAAGTMTVAIAIALLIAGIAAFYLLDTRPDWQRWGLAGMGLVAAVAVFALAPPGRRFWQFILDSRVELRKIGRAHV